MKNQNQSIKNQSSKGQSKKITNYDEYQRIKEQTVDQLDQEEEQDLAIRKRIYQKGFKISTMPSVKRPETNHNHQKPLLAKIDKEKQKKQVQSTILHDKKETDFVKPKINKDEKQTDTYRSELDFEDGMLEQYRKEREEKQSGMIQNSRKRIQTAKINANQNQDIRKNLQSAKQVLTKIEESNQQIKSMNMQNSSKKRRQSQKNNQKSQKQGQSSYNPNNMMVTQHQYSRIMSSKSIKLMNQKFGRSNNTLTSNISLHVNNFNSINNSFKPDFFNQKRLMSGLSAQRFTSKEVQRSTNVIDKYSGKHRIDERYYEDVWGKSKIDKKKTQMLAIQQIAQKKEEEEEEKEKEKQLKEQQLQQKRDNISNLDRFIDLILNNVTHEDEFIYLQRNDVDNPYDLKVINHQILKSEDIKNYFTISKKGLVQYQNGIPNEFLSLAEWVKERETYNQIKELKFFQQFQKWKKIKMWKKNVVRHRLNIVGKQLQERLFICNPILSETLLEHRKLCLEMEKLRFVETSQKQNEYRQSADQIPTLEMYKSIQEQKRKKTTEFIQNYSRISRENVRSGFKKCLQLLKTKHNNQNTNEDDFGKMEQNKKQFRTQESPYENLGFPDNMSYPKRVQLRKECSKFIKFTYLVDFIALQSLKNIYMGSVDEVLEDFQFMVNQSLESIVVFKEKGIIEGKNKNYKEPQFNVQLSFKQSRVNADELENDLGIDYIHEFVLPPLGESKPEDFNLLVHLRKKKMKEAVEEQPVAVEVQKGLKQQQQLQKQEVIRISDQHKLFSNDNSIVESDLEDERDYETMYERNVIINPSKTFLELHPNKNQFYSDILRQILEGINSIQQFERFSKHDEMTQYIQVLEDWDDMVGEDWQPPSSNYLNPQELLDKNPFQDCSQRINSLLSKVFDQADNYLTNYNDILQRYYENDRFDAEIFREEDIDSPSESLQMCLELLKDQQKYYQEQLPIKIDIGMLRIDCQDFKDKLIQQSKDTHSKMDYIPQLLKEKQLRIKDWLNKSVGHLRSGNSNIDDFVKQQKALKQIECMFPIVKDKISIIKQQYYILKDHKYKIDKDDDNLVNEITNITGQLQQTIMGLYDFLESNIETYTSKLQKNMIPKLNNQTSQLNNKVQDNIFYELQDEDEVLGKLREIEEEVKVVEDTSVKFNEYEKVLNIDRTCFDSLIDLRMDIDLRLGMWQGLKDIKSWSKQWAETPFILIDVEHIMQKTEQLSIMINRCQKNMIPNQVLDELKQRVYQYKETMPVVQALRNQFLKSHHWIELDRIVGTTLNINDDFSLQNLLDMKVNKVQNEILEVSIQATQEHKLEQEFSKQEEIWNKLEFNVQNYKDHDNHYIIAEFNELFNQIDELLANFNNILSSRYLKTLRKEVQKLQQNILKSTEMLDNWCACQSNFIYLENVFKNQEIRQKLAAESGQFETIDKYFKQQMRFVLQNNKLVHKAISNDRGAKIKLYRDQLQNINKSLENFCEQKCKLFPRFYFLSNDDLLDLLANSQNTLNIQKHIKKMFDAVSRFYFIDNSNNENEMIQKEQTYNIVNGVISAEGEIVKLKQISMRNEIEDNMKQLEETLSEQIKKNMRKGRDNFDSMEKKEWIEQHQSQVVQIISQIAWVSNIEHCIQQQNLEKRSLYYCYNYNNQQLMGLVDMIRQQISPIFHRVLVTLITQEVHNRDILENLTLESTTSTNDFYWLQQLRFYYDDDKDCIMIKQINSTLKYGYEYIGVCNRLVITPLTDKCWITVTNSLHIKLGACMQGPAGTGKTESIKDLGRQLGQICIVYNCSEQVTFKVMGQLYSGLIQQGAWTCLDEFNRIDIEVLSVIAQYMMTIRQGLLQDKDKLYFLNNEIPMNPRIGVFITMNPDYSGRQQLPDNLKILFRPMSMMIPGYQYICEVNLFSQGFINSKVLAGKLIQVYHLSAQQLSQQQHYDFGMRAVKSVLVQSGKLKQQNQEMNEEQLLIRAIIDSNLSKFTQQDTTLFLAIINDLFPNLQKTENNYEQLQVKIDQTMEQNNLVNEKQFNQKIIQFYDNINIRFGVMVLGQASSGKSTIIDILHKSMQVKMFSLNPKSISMNELYGYVDETTQEWQDGLASFMIREIVLYYEQLQIQQHENSEENKQQSMIQNWILFDGPIDPLWIENMNTVLDDSQMLCLANGQRIKLNENMRMVFEIDTLDQASPATISRCGVIYVQNKDLDCKQYIKRWLQQEVNQERFNENNQQLIQQLFNNSVSKAIQFLEQNKQHLYIRVNEIQVVSNILKIIESIGTKLNISNFNEDQKKYNRYITYVYAFSFIWSVGGLLMSNREDLDVLIREIFIQILFPNNSDVFNFYIDVNHEHDVEMKNWDNLLDEYQYDNSQQFYQIFVPTIDCIKNYYLIHKLVLNGKHSFVTGKTGTGKSSLIDELLTKIKKDDKIDSINLIFSAQTDSYTTQLSIEDSLSKIKKTQLSSKPGRKNVIFIDDINMPQKEQFLAQPPIELLRLFLDYEGFYDRKEKYFKNIMNTSLLVSGGINQTITQRFTRHFNIFTLLELDNQQLFQIYSQILNGFLICNGFNDSVKKMVSDVVNASIDFYQRIKQEQLPVPDKFFYTFNLRDISQVFQGIMMVNSNAVRDNIQLNRIWIHEIQRVFHDRLKTDKDREWCYNLIQELTTRYFRLDVQTCDITDFSLMFSNIMNFDRTYTSVKNVNQLIQNLNVELEQYNVQNFSFRLDLIFFKDSILHVLRLCRKLSQQRGNMMLIGLNGCGKQSLTKLASFINKQQVKQIEVSKSFTISNFKDFIRDLLFDTGLNDIPTVFLFSDNQIMEERYLEFINNLLNSGEVPNLMDLEQKDKIKQGIQDINSKMGRPDEPDQIYSTFVERCRNNLHIVLNMSPYGEQLRIRCRQFPSLINCLSLDWYDKWPQEALLSVCSIQLKNNPLLEEQQISVYSQIASQIHIDVDRLTEHYFQETKRKIYLTPKNFLDFINLFNSLLTKQISNIEDNVNRLKKGLDKLQIASEQVVILQEKITEISPQLQEQKELVEKAQIQLDEDQKVAKEKERVVQSETDQVNHQAHQIKMIAEDAQKELDQAMPELLAAMESVSKLEPQQIAEYKSMQNPPALVRLVMEPVCVLLDVKPTWENAKILMNEVNKFLNKILNLDRDNISDQKINIVKKYASDPKFNVNTVGQSSKVARDICQWVLSTLQYAQVNKRVQPRKKKVKEMQGKLNAAQSELSIKQNELKVVKDSVNALAMEMEKLQNEEQKLQDEIEQAQLKLIRAEKLTYLLADEKVRWQQSVLESQIVLKKQFGDIFITSGNINYCGPFDMHYRSKIQKIFIDLVRENSIEMSENYDIIQSISDNNQIREWMLLGLPNDSNSHMSSLIIKHGNRYPLIIDPQLQANKWLKNMDEMVVIKYDSDTLYKTVQIAIQNGSQILVEDVPDTIDPVLNSILYKQQYKGADGNMLIKFNEQLIDYHSSFFLYITTKIQNPSLLPEIFIKSNIVNFLVTFDGLQEQLLIDVVKQEQPEIEQQKDQLIIDLSQQYKNIKEIEDRILNLLVNCQSDKILDDDSLVNMLEESKEVSQEIKQKIEDSTVISKQIYETRNQYQDVAIRGSVLFFIIRDLSLIDPMYQYSLQYFIKIFNQAMKLSEPSNQIQQRLIDLQNSITKELYKNISMGLFENHKLLYSFLIAVNIEIQQNKIDSSLFKMFVNQQVMVDPQQIKIENPDPQLFQNYNLAYYLALNYDEFGSLIDDFSENVQDWKTYSQSNDMFELPEKYNQLSDFNKLLMIQIIKPDQLFFCIKDYIQKTIGEYYVKGQNYNLSSIYDQSDKYTAIIFLLESGAEPIQEIISFSEQHNRILNNISLGQGQSQVAINCIENSRKHGQWVLLQNCHLAKTFMQNVLEGLQDNPDIQNDNYRLFLTSKPCDYFPVSVLQNSIKLTTEPPKGIKNNLLKSIQGINEDYFELKDETDNQKLMFFRKLTFGLCYFHAIIQERVRFGSLGFNIKHQFNSSDLETSKTVLKMLMEEYQEIPWKALIFLTGQINYGGRITDEWDQKCLIASLTKIYTTKIMEPNYQFSQNEQYFISDVNSVQDIMDSIQHLTNNDDPEIFGLNANSNISYQLQEVNSLLNTIIKIQFSANQQSQEQSQIIHLITKIQEQIPDSIDEKIANSEMIEPNENGLQDSLVTVLFQEIIKFNRLLAIIKKSLKQLLLAVQGLDSMTNDLDQMHVAILNNQVPEIWNKVSYSTLKPLGSYIQDLNQKIQFMKNWLKNGYPLVYWLSAFYFPQCFLTGLLQTFSRKYNISIDSIQFSFKITENAQEQILLAPLEGAYIMGLYLEGASWDKKKKSLVEQQMNETYYAMPVIHLNPVENKENNENDYLCPVYKTTERSGTLSSTGLSTNYIMAIDIPSTLAPNYWTLRGTALITQLDN